MLFSRKPTDADNDVIVTLPSHVLHPVLGKVSYRTVGAQYQVMFTILLSAVGDEGWQTGVALDASVSMRHAFGRALAGRLPDDVRKQYIEKGWIYEEVRDGEKRVMYKSAAYDDAIREGHLKWTENTVQPDARKFIQFLADNLDADGGTTVIYWACGKGDEIEVLGDVRGSECPTLSIKGPDHAGFGASTQLLPALKYFDERFVDAKHGMYIFITDGRLDDLEAVKAYCVKLAQRIERGERNPLKCILIGVGSEIDEKQMIALDDLDTGTDVDIWDHKIAKDLRDVTEIFAELVDDSLIIAPMGTVTDFHGNVAARFTDGLPARVEFRMPKTSTSFVLEMPGVDPIRQSIVTE
ncbi:MAG: vWA domain-containing protein [Armatimonadota bacterium]